MSDALVVRRLDTGRYEWMAAGGLGQVVQGDVTALESAAGARPLAVVMDGRTVRTLEAAIPARSQRQAEQAAPFVIEDEVAEDLEQLHVVCGAVSAPGRRTVAVVRHQEVQQLLEPLRAAGHRIAHLVPDYLALPWRPEHWSLLQDGGRVQIRTAAERGFACDADALDGLLARLPATARPRALDLFGAIESPAALHDVPHQRHAVPDSVLGLMARGIDSPRALDLLPAQWRARGPSPRRSGWLAAGLLVLALGLHVGLQWRAIAATERALAEVRTAQVATLQQAFPQMTRIVNAEVQAAQAVADLRSTYQVLPSALEMIHHVGRGLRADPAGSALVLENLNYADGVLGVRLHAPDIAALERYSAALKGPYAVEVVAVEAQTEGVTGTLRLQPSVEATP